MSVTSVLPDRPTPYRPISGNISQRGKFATTLSPDRAAPTDHQGTVEAGHADPTEVSQFQSALAQALRADEATIHPELRPVHNQFYARWQETVARIVRRGQRQGVFLAEVDVDGVTRRLTALTDGAAIQVLTGAPGMTVTVMRELLVEFVRRELIPPGNR